MFIYKRYSPSRLSIFLFLIISFQSCDFLFSCQDDILHSRSGYEFEISISLTPIKETYKIGDTIRVDIDFSNEVYDRTTDEHYLMEDVHFRPRTVLTKILEGGDTSSFVSSFANFNVIVPQEYNYGVIRVSSGQEFIGNFFFMKMIVINLIFS